MYTTYCYFPRAAREPWTFVIKPLETRVLRYTVKLNLQFNSKTSLHRPLIRKLICMLSTASGLKYANRCINSASLLRVQYICLVQSNNKKQMIGLNFAVLDRIHQHREIQDPRESFRSFLSTSTLRCTTCSK